MRLKNIMINMNNRNGTNLTSELHKVNDKILIWIGFRLQWPANAKGEALYAINVIKCNAFSMAPL